MTESSPQPTIEGGASAPDGGLVRRSRLRQWAARLRPRRLLATLRWLAAIFGDVRRRARDPRLTVGIDANPLWEELTGVGWSLHKLVEALADREGVALRLYGPALVAFDPPTVPHGPPFGCSVETVRYPVVEDLTLPPSWQERLLKLLAPLLIRWERNDVIHAHNFFLPRPLRISQRRSRSALSVVVHDLAMRRFAWTLAEATRIDLERHLDQAVSVAAVIVTPSQAVKDEIVAEGWVDADSVTVVRHGPGHLGPGHLQTGHPAPEEGAAPEAPPGESFALHVGTLEPRKNLETLLEAWPRARAHEPRVPRLVLCGARGWKNDRLHAVVERGQSDGWLELPGYVSQDELWRYYRQALFLACPSHYEGFGLPLVEAMSAGTPLLLSDIAVFREVAGEAGDFVSASDAGAWADAIVELVRSPRRLEELAAAARERVRLFSWSRAADEMLGVWQRVGASAHRRRCGGGSADGDALPEGPMLVEGSSGQGVGE